MRSPPRAAFLPGEQLQINNQGSHLRLIQLFAVSRHLSFDSTGLGSGVNCLPERAVVFYATDYPEAGQAVAELITASGFSPVNVGGVDQSIRIEVGGNLHEFGKLGKLVSAKEAEALV